MREFKFLKYPIAYSHHDEPIFADEIFYTMNKEDMESVTGEIIPKYTIMFRRIVSLFRESWKPDYDKILYFKKIEGAEDYKRTQLRWEEDLKWMIKIYDESNIIITDN